MSDLVGRLLGQNYRVIEPIGAGAMGMVFVVEHVNLPKRFAAKVLTPDLARHPEAIARFEVEARAVSQLEHENIVSVVDFGETDDGCFFIIMELLRGKTLQARIDQGPASLEEIVGITIQVCRALAAAHAAGIVHRDIKPDNVFLAHRPGRRPLVKILDFGVSRPGENSPRQGRITRRGQVLGSPEYMSPEASRGEDVDARADVYAVGIILYQLLCGDVPFRHENYLEVLQMHASQAPLPPRALAPDLPDAVERVILRALEKDPALRQPSIEEFEFELIGALPEVAQRAMSATQLPAHAPWARRSAPPTEIVGHAHAPLAQGSVNRHAPQGERDTATLVIRRLRGRKVVLGLWACALGVAAAAGIALWLDRRDLGVDPAAAGGAARGSLGAAHRPQLHDGDQGAELAGPPADPPEAIAVGDRPRRSARAGDIHLRIDSSPLGATVSLEGRRLGRTPIDTKVLSADRHGELELQLRGYRTARRSIALDRDGQVRVSLQRDLGTRQKSGRSEPSTRSSSTGDGSDLSEDAPDIKERR